MEWFRDLFAESALSDLAITNTLLNLLLVLLLGQVLSWHYLHFSVVLSNKRKFARLLIFLSATTMLVISVVKTSLALSLGLVGALSIIRFRTPIKEPEELAYLFLAVALGIGMGADQRASTAVVFLVILVYLALQGRSASRSLGARTLLHVNADLGGGANGQTPERALEVLLASVQQGTRRVDLRRLDSHEATFDANLILDLDDPSQIGSIVGRVRKALPSASVSVVEASSLD